MVPFFIPVSQPPDVTNNTGGGNNRAPRDDRIARYSGPPPGRQSSSDAGKLMTFMILLQSKQDHSGFYRFIGMWILISVAAVYLEFQIV